MERIVPHLHMSAGYELGFGNPPLVARSFVLERPQGNLLLYSAATLTEDLDAVRDLGGVTRQYLGHVHEASDADRRLRGALGAPLHAHVGDAAAISRTVAVDEPFAERHCVGDDFEVIPAPGHTPGSTAYHWTTPDGLRVLFPGDTLYLRHGEWVAAFLDGISDRAAYVQSLRRLAELDVDLLAAGAAPAGQPPFAATDPLAAREQIMAAAERLWAGGDR